VFAGEPLLEVTAPIAEAQLAARSGPRDPREPRPVPVAFSQQAERLHEQAHQDVARRVAATQ